MRNSLPKISVAFFLLGIFLSMLSLIMSRQELRHKVHDLQETLEKVKADQNDGGR